MLRRVEVENLFSIRERQALDLTVPRTAPDLPLRLPATRIGEHDRTTLVAAVFGANASGKTSFLRGMAFGLGVAAGATNWQVGSLAPIARFADKPREKGPSRIYYEFDGQLVSSKPPCLYSYELVVEPSGTGGGDRIRQEVLRYRPGRKWARLMERSDQSFDGSPEFQLSPKDPRLQYVAETASAIPILAKFNHALSIQITQQLRGVQTNIAPFGRVEFGVEYVTNYYVQNPLVLDALRKKIQVMDLGIEDIQIEKHAAGLGALFRHRGLSTQLPIQLESDGTRNFYCLFPFIWFVLKSGGLAILDEFDRDIHPLLLPEIVRWFHDPAENTNKAQLVMSCHNATILDYLIKEEVFFTQKNQHGATELYGLQDMSGVRRVSNLYSSYLAGRFGAVPRVG